MFNTMTNKRYLTPAAGLLELVPTLLYVSDPDVTISNGEDMDPWEDNDDNN